MTIVTNDYKRGCYLVELGFGDKQYLVDVYIELGRLKGVRARSLNGTMIQGDLAHHLHSQAALECGAWLMSELSQKHQYRAISKEEVVEIAFIATLLEWSKDVKRELPRLGPVELRLLQRMAQSSRRFMQNAHADAYITRRPLRQGSFRALIDTAIRNEWKLHQFTERHREFFESVLMKAFGWKQLIIPGDVYYLVEKYRTGLLLAFELAERP